MAAMASQAALTVNFPRWQVGQRAVVPVGEEFLDDGLVAVLPFGLDGDVWRSAPRLTAITWRPGVCLSLVRQAFEGTCGREGPHSRRRR